MEELSNYRVIPRYVIKTDNKAERDELWKKAYDTYYSNGIGEEEKETLLDSILEKRYFLLNKDGNFVEGRSFPTEERAVEFIKEMDMANKVSRLKRERDSAIKKIYEIKEELSLLDSVYGKLKDGSNCDILFEGCDIVRKPFEKYVKMLHFLPYSKIKEIVTEEVKFEYKEKVAQLKFEKGYLKGVNKEIGELKKGISKTIR